MEKFRNTNKRKDIDTYWSRHRKEYREYKDKEKMRNKCLNLKKAAVVLVIGALTCSAIACGAAENVIQEQRTDTAMGTIVRQSLYVRDNGKEKGKQDIRDYAEEIMECIDELESDVLSWRIEGSEVWKINETAKNQRSDAGAAGTKEEKVSEASAGEEEEKVSEALAGAEEEKVSEASAGAEEEKGSEVSAGEEEEKVSETSAEIEEEEFTKIPQELADMLAAIWEVSQESDGALDVTIGSVARLWNLDAYAGGERTGFQPPEQETVEAALQRTGYEKVVLEDNAIFLPQGMELDLGAVGKGIACGKIAEYLEEQEEIEGAVISVGGSILTYGNKPDGTPWRVGITDPENPSGNIGYLTLEGQWCVSTSGSYERYAEYQGKRYHHILDPETGCPADSGVLSVTILCRDGLLSDALSTAGFVLGWEDGLALAEHFDALALFVDSEGEIHMSEGMEAYFRH